MSDQPSSWRGELDRGDLIEANVPADPLTLFEDWFEAAKQTDLKEPTAMTLATIEPDGTPGARIVLLRGFDADGFRFYTNHDSSKGQALAANPQAALVFWWEPWERQVRITGDVETLPAATSTAYFDRRPLGSQISALASPQSQIVSNRGELESRVNEAEAQYRDVTPERPAYWGGYNVVPNTIEFWQARQNRLHDRLRYRRLAGGWQLDRLAP